MSYGEPPTPRKRRGQRGWMLDRGAHPGVGISLLHLSPNAPPESAHCGRKGLGQCRKVCHGHANTQTAKQASLLVINVYLPSGTEARTARETFQSRLLEEVMEWGSQATVIVGDFNMDLKDASLMAQLSPCGWRRPFLVSPEGVPQSVTFFSGPIQSGLDDFVISPDAHTLAEVALVTRVPGMQHCVLSLMCRQGSSEEAPHVLHPPQLQSTRNRHIVTPVDWQEVNDKMHGEYLRLVQETRADPWFHVDTCLNDSWNSFMCAYKRHLEACHVDGVAVPN